MTKRVALWAYSWGMITRSKWRWTVFITRPIMLHIQYFRLCASLHLGWRTPLNITSVSTRSTPTPAMGSQKYTVTNRSMQRRCCSTLFIKFSDKHSLEGSGRRWCPRHQSNYNIQGKGGRNSKDCLLPSLRPLTVQCLLWKRWSSDCPFRVSWSKWKGMKGCEMWTLTLLNESNLITHV